MIAISKVTMVIQKKLFTHDVNIDVPFITALGVAYNHLGKMHEVVFLDLGFKKKFLF